MGFLWHEVLLHTVFLQKEKMRTEVRISPKRVNWKTLYLFLFDRNDYRFGKVSCFHSNFSGSFLNSLNLAFGCYRGNLLIGSLIGHASADAVKLRFQSQSFIFL